MASLSVAAVLILLLGYGAASLAGLIERWGASPGGLGVLAGWMALAALALPLMRARPTRRAMAMLSSHRAIVERVHQRQDGSCIRCGRVHVHPPCTP